MAITHEVLAVYLKTASLEVCEERYHTACYPRKDRIGPIEQIIRNDCQIQTASGQKCAVLVEDKDTNNANATMYQSREYFVGQVCSVCGLPIMYQTELTYNLNGVSKVGPGYDPVQVGDILYHFFNYWPLRRIATVGYISADLLLNVVTAKIFSPRPLSQAQLLKCNVNGEIPLVVRSYELSA